ncbi:bacterioferritin-associated ferredoxin [uncultured Tateyamaria sp.]|uniref:(2Fe-2S)-binding protein n=1 Tax=uncultured Tateyamaria sp. TaxID=455651 RepID=UPI00260A8E42|nr:(2Fe-2S)-binding protein [uncultured Tateyamaria sp.]
MIICHCQTITDHDIHAAIDWMRAADPETLITPGKVYRALGKAADCGGCVPLFLGTMRENPNLKIPQLKPMHLRDPREATQEIRYERRQKSNSIP